MNFMKQKITFDTLDLSLVISDLAHGIGTLEGIQKILVSLKHEDIDLEKLTKVIGEIQRRLSSAQDGLMRHYFQGESID